MAAKKKPAANHPDVYLGTPWTPSGAPMPDPPMPLTERSAGLGFSRYV